MIFKEIKKSLKKKVARLPTAMDYVRHIFSEEPIDAILQGHLAIEILIIEILRRLGYSSRDIKDMKFADKIDGLVSRKILDRKHILPYIEFNDLRNLYAHQMGFQLEAKDLLRFLRLVHETGGHNVTKLDGTEFTEEFLREQGMDIGVIAICDALTLELNEKLSELDRH